MKRLILPAALVLIAVCAQAADKVPVYVSSTTPDTVGTTYVYQFREQLQASQGYRLVTNELESKFIIGVVTLDPDDGPSANKQTVAAVTLAIENL